jgi:hypothetical protein
MLFFYAAEYTKNKRISTGGEGEFDKWGLFRSWAKGQEVKRPKGPGHEVLNLPFNLLAFYPPAVSFPHYINLISL